MEKTQMSVEARKVLDIRDKELLYVIIEYKGKKVAINVGNKTYASIVELVTEPQPVIPELEGEGTVKSIKEIEDKVNDASNDKKDAKPFITK